MQPVTFYWIKSLNKHSGFLRYSISYSIVHLGLVTEQMILRSLTGGQPVEVLVDKPHVHKRIEDSLPQLLLVHVVVL